MSGDILKTKETKVTLKNTNSVVVELVETTIKKSLEINRN